MWGGSQTSSRVHQGPQRQLGVSQLQAGGPAAVQQLAAAAHILRCLAALQASAASAFVANITNYRLGPVLHWITASSWSLAATAAPVSAAQQLCQQRLRESAATDSSRAGGMFVVHIGHPQ